MGPDGLPVSLTAAIKLYYTGFPQEYATQIIEYIDGISRIERQAYVKQFQIIIDEEKAQSRDIDEIQDAIRELIDQIIRAKGDEEARNIKKSQQRPIQEEEKSIYQQKYEIIDPSPIIQAVEPFDFSFTQPAGNAVQNLQFAAVIRAEESANIGRQIAEAAAAQAEQGSQPATLKNIQVQPYFEEDKKIKEEASRIRTEQEALVARLAAERDTRILQIGKENTELFENLEFDRLKKEQEQRSEALAIAAKIKAEQSQRLAEVEAQQRKQEDEDLEASLIAEIEERARQRAEDEKAKLLAVEKEPDRLFEYTSNTKAISTISKALVKNDDTGIAKYITQILDALQYYKDRGTERLDITLKNQELLMIKAFIVSKYYELRKVLQIEVNAFNEVKQLVDAMIRTLEEIVDDFKYNTILEVGNRINRMDNTVRREYMGPDPNKSDFLQRIDVINRSKFRSWTTPVFPNLEPGTPEQRSPTVVKR